MVLLLAPWRQRSVLMVREWEGKDLLVSLLPAHFQTQKIEEVRVVLEKPSLSESIPHNIVIRQFPLGENTAEEVLLRETVLQPSDMQVEDIEKFDRVLINGRTFYAIVVERFEAQIQSYYYLPRETDVLRFEVHERDVVDWMEPTLQIEELPEHTALLTLLTSLQSP